MVPLIATMLAADAELEGVAHLAAALGRDLDQLAHTLAIERDERIDRHDSLRHIGAEEARRVVARDAERGLRQVVGAEGEELRPLCNLASGDRGAGQLDHGADAVVEILAHGAKHLLGDVEEDGSLVVELPIVGHEGNHDLRTYDESPSFRLERGLEDRAALHLGDLGVRDAEPATAMPQHGVGLAQ